MSDRVNMENIVDESSHERFTQKATGECRDLIGILLVLSSSATTRSFCSENSSAEEKPLIVMECLKG